MGNRPTIPRPSLARLPQYYRRLLQISNEGQKIVSSQELSEEAGVPAAQVRKDLTYVGESGRPGVGYDVNELAAELEQFLGLARVKKAVLVGAGNLGRALTSYPGFARYKLQIVGLFDHNPAIIGGRVGSTEIRPLDELVEFVLAHDITIGILAVPAPPAQTIAERLVEAGIRVIWNFAPVALQVPSGIMVFNEDLAVRLATLSYYISQQG